MRFTQVDVSDQREVLRKLAEMTARSIVHPSIREAAIAITGECDARDEECELQAIYDAVKHGTPHVAGLRNGYRYVADPRQSDYFTAPYRTLELCARGSCAGDCDDHSMLCAALAGALGFKVGLRAWGPKGQDYEHVYAVACKSKRNPSIEDIFAMDTTVESFDLGDEPPPGRVLTAWLEDE